MPISQHIVLLGSAASIGFIHTLLGPDHYIPFIALSKARSWNMRRTLAVTFLCGIGHVLGSVLLGIVGILIGTAVSKIEAFESLRGHAASWVLIGFGLAYMVWGIFQAIKNKPHTHLHVHPDGETHEHSHTHHDSHSHLHSEKKTVTMWTLFIIFALGPCEPLIPLLMYPASSHSWGLVVSTALVFSAATISTMLIMVGALTFGFKLLPMKKLERYAHAMAGAVILFSGIGIKFLGW